MADPMRDQQLASAPGRLASGRIRRWVVGKPRLATTEGAPIEPRQERLERTRYRAGVAVRASIVVAVFTSVVAAASWLILIATVLATPVIGNTIHVVQRAPWVEGRAPQGEIVYIAGTTVDRTLGGKIALQFQSDEYAAIMQIIAPANATLGYDDTQTLTVNGTPVTLPVPTTIQPGTTGDTYLVACLTGPCGPRGTVSRVPVDRVVGTVLNTLTSSGIQPAPTGVLTPGASGE